MTDQRMEDNAYARIEDQLKKTAEKLRSIADEVERVSMNDHKGERREPAAIVADVLHQVNWGIVNLPIESMLGWAQQIGEVRRLGNDAD